MKWETVAVDFSTVSFEMLLLHLMINMSCQEKTFPMSYANNLSLVVRKPDFRICKNKDADQPRGNR